MEYTGKYKEMAEQFRKNGLDEYTIERFIRQEMESDKFETIERRVLTCVGSTIMKT